MEMILLFWALPSLITIFLLIQELKVLGGFTSLEEVDAITWWLVLFIGVFYPLAWLLLLAGVIVTLVEVIAKGIKGVLLYPIIFKEE